MIETIKSAVAHGLEGFPITIELSAGNGMPGIYIVGLPNTTIKEAKSRLRVAFKQAGIALPSKKFVFNLLPANMKKQGSHLDLPFAVALLKACQHEVVGESDWGYLGELSLSGHIKGFASAFTLVEALVHSGCKTIVISAECQYVMESFPETTFMPISHLTELFIHAQQTLQDKKKFERPKGIEQQYDRMNASTVSEPEFCLDEVYGHEVIKRALLLAVAGGHHTLMIGPPGTGKTLLAKSVSDLLPPLSMKERMELMKIHSFGEQYQSLEAIERRPFRTPHASMSAAGMFGGRQMSSIGEVTLAHRGILFLDELPEFKRDVIEGLRYPLESGTVSVSKAGHKSEWPSDFLLIASANPCPCGYRGYSDQCQCHEGIVSRYYSKLSGPILDRFDIKIDVSLKTTSYDLFMHSERKNNLPTHMTHDAMKHKVIQVRAIQQRRFGNDTTLNGKMSLREIDHFCKLDDEGEQFIHRIYQESSDSIRSFHKLLKLARTIADLEECPGILVRHLSEAYYYNRRQLV